MRLRVSHSTTYRYDPPATGVIQVLRLTPGNHDGQYVVDWRIDVSTDSRLDMREDAFGNITHVFSYGPIAELTFNVSGEVETQDTGGILRGTIENFPPQFFLRPTTLTEADETMTAYAANLHAAAGGDPLGFLHALLTSLTDEMTFDIDPTHTGTTAGEAFKLKRGVCQDYAQIFIGCARGVGIPARFVAGHFFRSDGIVHQDAGHAWAEAYVPDLGWVGFDPANGISTTDAHVRVAIGLDYLGAAPIRGTRYGGGVETLDVQVKVDQAYRQQGQSQSQS
jgi:transglutaminase-like putative cysteine protease